MDHRGTELEAARCAKRMRYDKDVNKGADEQHLVSVIMPVYNGKAYLGEALQSVVDQTHRPLQLSAFDDGSSDGSWELLGEWQETLTNAGIHVVLGRSSESVRDVEAGTCGPGYARNRAVRQSTGSYLCFLDCDDVMIPTRVARQLEVAAAHPGALVGCGFVRDPPEATPRYTEWCNGLSDDQLVSHRFRDCTVIQPTWFMGRPLYDAVGGYEDKGWAEDLKLFYRLFNEDLEIKRDAVVMLVREPLLRYRHLTGSVTSAVSKQLLRTLRIGALERQVLKLPPWCRGFGIWGAGKNGKAFYRSLSPEFQQRVTAFYDVDEKKVGKPYNDHGPDRKHLIRSIPVLHADSVEPPFITCVSLDRTGGAFEDKLRQRNLVEGVDYFCFS